MLRLTLKLALILVALTALALSALHSLPNRSAGLRALIVPPSSCAVPCWQGIQIGVTTREQAAQLLAANPWVAQVYQTSIAVTWHWNGRQPPEINGSEDGLLEVESGIVREIRVQTFIPLGDVWLLMDRPDNGLLVRPLSQFSAYQVASYDIGMQAISSLECPTTPAEYWSAPITLGIGGLDPSDVLNSRAANIYQLSGWWSYLRFC